MEVFNRFCRSGHSLSERDLQKAFKKLRFEVSSRDFKELLKRFDSDGNGRIALQEFCDFIDPDADLRDLRGRFDTAVRRLSAEGVTLKSLFVEEDPRDTGVCTVSGFQSVVERKMMVPLNEYELRRIMFRFDTRQSHETVVRLAARASSGGLGWWGAWVQRLVQRTLV